MNTLSSHRLGFTLLEILLTVSLIIALSAFSFISVREQINKAHDINTKRDMDMLKKVFEEYYSDHNCYPPYTWFDGPEDCGRPDLKPYLDSIPCDRRTGNPYQMVTDMSGCKWYGIYANLTNVKDSYCVRGLPYNYVVGSSNLTPQTTCPNTYYCKGVGNCVLFDAEVWDCTPGYPDPSCTGSHSCVTTGSCMLR